MKKYYNYYRNFVLTIVAICSTILFTACPTPDDGLSKEELTSYKWFSQYKDFLLYDDDDLELSIQTESTWLYFLFDGTGIMSIKSTDKDTYFGTSREETAYKFKYTLSGNKVHISFNGKGPDDRTLAYAGGYLIDDRNEDIIYKQLSFESSELNHAKELADEQEFLSSINHNAFQSLNVKISFGNSMQPVKFTSEYSWWISSFCVMPEDSDRRGIATAGLVVYIDNGTITNKTGYDKDLKCSVSATTLDGKKAYYYEHVIFYNEETKCGAAIHVNSNSGSSLTIHYAYRYYDRVSKKYFTSPSKVYVLTGEGIDASGGGNTDGNAGDNTGGGDMTSATGTHNGHEWVDLGLSVKWATVNIGANSLEEYGEYYAWGETQNKTVYNWDTYKWGTETHNITKYCTNSDYGKVDNKSILSPEDDVAHVNWGGSWRMPTKEEQDELCTQCRWTWTTLNGVDGYKVTSIKNGNSIFLPYASFRSNSTLWTYESRYWSSSLDSQSSGSASFLRIMKDYKNTSECARYCGHSVRAVY